MPCVARYTTVKDKIYFGDGKHRFYLERCCGAQCEGTICPKCQVKNQIKVQDCRTFDHGVIGGPYPAKSQLFDSPYYHAAVVKYGPPNAADLERAREAQRMARGGTKVVEKPTLTSRTEAPVASVKVPEVPVAKTPKPKVKKERVKKEPSEPTPKVKRQPKQIAAPTLQAPVEETKPVVKIPDAPMESMDDPLPVTEVIKVTLKPFKIGTATYWRDGEREKLYKKEGNKRGAYVGRWDSQSQSIVRDAPDSDAD